MNRMITVKGTGNISVKPDLIVIKMNLESQNHDYNKTMEIAAASVKVLQDAIISAGFDKKDLKQRISTSTHIIKAIMIRTIIIKADLMDTFANKV